MLRYFNILFIVFSFVFCNPAESQTQVKTGAELTNTYLSLLSEKRIGIIANQTSLINSTHLVDSLLSLKVNVRKIFSPEHGFRGDADAGEHVKSYKDKKTGIEVVSLYGDMKKPKKEVLDEIDLMIFDIQDVGVRFYTYTTTMHYVMEACAEHNVPFLILDRPNPNGFYVDGPVLDMKYSSFVGMHPVPLVHGMTIGEYAKMINEEGWLKNGVKCNLQVIPCENYTHKTLYHLPVKPSPNLPNMTAIYLYPVLCLFEGTVISVARGTDFPFQAIGHPSLINSKFFFTPTSKPGAKNPSYKGKKCFGYDFRNNGTAYFLQNKKLNLQILIDTYKNLKDRVKFFTSFFTKLAGNITLRKQIEAGVIEADIRKSWEKDLEQFKNIRKKYLLYEDF
ncbi:MAG: hypothetical protein A2275_01210 [Bacteroidetes bacterium RIFOXYA12_FULL_35_11]|nr:MAG: hypothetical protein A2X01_20070 [Bacteroidetes bacterium GWF2_35_48]OFY74549.1 MAG: hypothetical protein A2275_01210 [Bacteroidetes bacterium RIFOXYA12_FULL_35_11]OFY95184.1 MAG: hypothetical protein A2309_14125 [Bacteroidetes bacterium RIFOXYB2_FULL_35_7]HBX52866.1 DUF1343 domain-containing protein [Bacteroidales bacterium]